MSKIKPQIRLFLWLAFFLIMSMQNIVAQTCSDVGTTRINIETTDLNSGYPDISKLGNSILVSYMDVDTWETKNKIVDENGNVSDMLSTSISPSTNDNSDSVFYKGLSNGNVLVYWYSSSSGTGFTDAYFKIINSSGAQIVGSTKINTLAGSLNRFVESEQLSNGNIVFTWATGGQDYSMRRFTQTGIAVDANQISLTSLAGLTGQSQYAYKIAANSNGKFMILIDYYSLVYKAMIFNNDATTPIQVNGANSFTAATAGISGAHVDKIPNIVTLPNNKFLLAYQIQTGIGTETRSLALKVYNEDGSVAVDQKVIRQLYSWGAIYKPVVTPTGFYLSSMYNDLGNGPGLGAKSFLEKYDFDCNLISDLSNCFSGLDEYATVLPFNDVNDNLGFLINNTEGTANYNIWILRNVTSCTAPTITANPPNRTICNGSNTTFTSNATGATGFQWQVNTGSGFTDITNGGVYSNATTNILTITGATAIMSGYQYRCKAINGIASCFSNSNNATLSVSNMTVTTLTKANIQCYNDNNGSASLSTSGGIAPYTYSWAPSGGTGSSASGLAPGTYTITVTDNIGCTKTHQVVINGPTVAFTATSSTTAVSCFGGNNGTATITATGGTAPYTYAWSTGAVTQSITGRQAGTYSVTVTDDNGCELLVENIVIGQPAAMLDGTPSSTSVSCFGGNNGTATIAPTGGTPSYTYLWSNGATTATASNLLAGTYSVTITDANSCQRTITGIVVGGPAAALSGTPSVTTVSCNGGSNGTASISPAGGTPGYTYVWSNGATSQTITGLQAGVYNVTITDANSCTRTINNILVSQPSAINSNATQTNVSCFNGANGTATVAPTGGAGSYTYLWAHSGSTNASVNGLTAGTYTVKITDNNACEKNQSFTISEPPAVVLTRGTINNVSCFNGSNGTATVSATGGAGSFTYSWSPTGGTAATASGLTAGTYTVTVTDANACQATESFTINQPAAALTVSSRSQNNITCSGTPTGSASVVVTGGTGSYTYSWSPSGGTAASATGLYSGTYTVSITDANNCQTSETFTITEPANPLTASQGAIVNIACHGNTTGSATVNVVGGDGNYTYSWAPSGGTAATATGLAAGTYTVTVTDGASCQATQTFTIIQPLAALAATTASTGVSCFGGSNGTASVTASNGTFPYTYAWAPLGGSTASVSGRPAGDYTCTITDANGCTLVKNIRISTPAQFTATVSKTDVSCNGGSNGTATITPSGATAPYSYTWTPFGGSNASASGLSAGTYNVIVQDANTCQYSVSVTIDQPAALTATASQINVACFGDNNGEASVIATGGTAPYTYIWSPVGGTADTATGLTAGNYSVLITDSRGCFSTRSFTIAQPTNALVATKGTTTDVSCNGGSNGSATVNVTGGTGAYTYIWMPSGETSATASALTAGTNTVTVTDANNCTATQSFIITQPSAISFTTTILDKYNYDSIYTQTVVTLGGSGTKTFAITAGSLPQGFSLSSTGVISGKSTQLADSNFTITVTDVNNCTVSKNFDLKLNQIPITITANASQSKVYGENDPTFTFTTSPNLLPGDSFTGALERVSGENVGSYQIAQGSLSAGDKYLIIYNSNNFSITAKPITVTATTKSKTYGDIDTALTYDFAPALVNGDTFTGSLTRLPGENVGAYAINQNTLALNSNYTLTYVGADLTIGAKTITVTAAAKSKTYGEADPALTYTFAPALVTGDTFSGSISRSLGENVGTHEINQGTLALSSNYTLTYVDADLTIGKKTVTVTAAAKSKTYGDVDPALTYTFAPALVTGDAFSGNLTRTPNENVGTYAINQGGLTLSNNYTLTYVGANLTIGKKTITVTAASKSKTYGNVDPALTYTFAPALVTGDAFSGNLTRTPNENVGTYAINQGRLTLSNNYTLTYVGANLTIGKKTITVTAAAKSKTYGDVDPALTYDFAPALVTGDTFSGNLTRANGNNVGTYAINQGTLALNSNYTLTYVSNNLVITAKPITVTANASQSKVYGTADPVYTYSVSPALVSGDSFTGALGRVAGNDAGVYAITQGTLSAGTNYNLTYVGSNFTIVKANQTITWNQTLGFGCEGETTVILTATSSSGLPVSYTSSNSNLVSISGNSLNLLNYGSVTISANQLGNNNYNPAVVVSLPLVNSQPNLIRKQFENIIFFDNSSKSFSTYTWYKNGVLVPGQTDQYFKENGPLNGTYYAVATKLDGIAVTTCPLVLSPTIEDEYIKIVPNPVKPNASYELLNNVPTARLQNARIEVYSVGGLLLENKTTSQNTVTLKAPTVEGIYIIKMTLANGKYFTKNLLVKN